MAEIELILSDRINDSKVTSLFYTSGDTPIAKKYFSCLEKTLENKIAIFEPERFYNFPNDYRDRNWIARQLNECIETINQFAPGTIQRKAEPHMSQDLMNYLHHFFETYRGSITKPASFFIRAPNQVKKALEDYNLLIHRYEDYCKNENRVQQGRGRCAKMVLTFEWSRKRHLLSEEDYLQFTRVITFGNWYINYCEVGKQIWDVYRDQDDVIGDDNIRPLRYYSADAMIEFSPTTTPEGHEKEMKEFWNWWDTKAQHLKALGFEKHDPKNAIGLIPVAQLNRMKGDVAGMSDEQMIDHIGQYQYMKAVQTHG